MEDPWTFDGESPTILGGGGTVTLVEESSFTLSGRGGDIRPGTIQGLFVMDTRLLSRLELSIDGLVPEPLAVALDEPFAATFVSRVRRRDAPEHESPLLVLRRRYVGSGMREDVTVRNHNAYEVRLNVHLAIDSDFADLFAVKEGRAKPEGEQGHRMTAKTLHLIHRGSGVHREVALAFDGDVVVEPDGGHWQVVLAAGGEWTSCLGVSLTLNGEALPPRYVCGEPVADAQPKKRIEAWRRMVPLIQTSDPALAQAVGRSLEDLGSLRLFDVDDPDRVAVAAGAPWFMTVFGRDSLLTAYMSLLADPDLALGVLQTLAQFQGTKVVTETEEQPGRILHEMRFGSASSAGLSSATVYYGTADATPLFVVLLGELRRWGLNNEAVDTLLPHADRALAWIDDYGDRDGDGFVEYERMTPQGLANQGWKDSWDGIPFADGTQPKAPIALAEVQGYVYAAYLARAHFAEETGDTATLLRYQAKAADLRLRFNEAFWLPDKGWYALALDGDKRPVDALGTNMGHCLWSGIVDEDKAEQVADHLLSKEMFSGWGIRTLATSMATYDPMSYHCGSVWPHDNAIIVSGLIRYGFVDHAHRVIRGMLDAAAQTGGRLPELFSGIARDDVPVPVAYPASCSPQAWAAATPVQFVRLLLRLDPELPHRRVWLAPSLPPSIAELTVSRVPIGSGLTVEVSAAGVEVSGLDPAVALIRRPREPLPAAAGVVGGGAG
jgi:glycogen debranching enzyme